MKELPISGEKKEHYLQNLELNEEGNENLRHTNNQFAKLIRKSNDAARVEIMQSTVNFPNERMKSKKMEQSTT